MRKIRRWLTPRWCRDGEGMTCPVCNGVFWTLHGVYLHRHPRRVVHSRLGAMAGYATCERCGNEFGFRSDRGLGLLVRGRDASRVALDDARRAWIAEAHR